MLNRIISPHFVDFYYFIRYNIHIFEYRLGCYHMDIRYIKDTELQLLLERKRKYIGKHVSWDLALTGLLFALPLIPTDFNELWGISGEIVKWVFVSFGIIIFLIGAFQMLLTLPKNKQYNHMNLYQDIVKLEPPAKEHSLIAIKDTFNTYPNRYLLYYDKKWGCRFFPNFKTAQQENEISLIEHLSVMLHIPKDNIKLELKAERVQQKYSPHDEAVNIYHHKLYLATIASFPEIFHNNSFSIEDQKFYWMSVDQMLGDKNIQEKNLSVVSFVKENC